jgi:hypothetical protein
MNWATAMPIRTLALKLFSPLELRLTGEKVKGASCGEKGQRLGEMGRRNAATLLVRACQLGASWQTMMNQTLKGVTMPRDIFDDRKKGQEEDYFRKKERELIEKMRRRREAETERQQMAEALGVGDDEVLRDLQEMGYTRELVPLLHLVPLVQVAWAEGNVSQRERELILQAARSHGVEPGSLPDQKLDEWLDQRPSGEFFERTLRVLGALLQALPPEQREASRKNLISYSTNVAAASGGILGLGNKISNEERALLESITAELERGHADAARQVLDQS